MSSATRERAAVISPSGLTRRLPLARFADRQTELLIVTGLIGVAVAMLAFLPRSIAQDTWLALMAGREVAHHGIPSHETLTIVSSGRSWVDQQWLSQLFMWSLYHVGGLALVGVVNVGLMVSGLALSVRSAQRLGASARSIITVLPLAAMLVVISGEVRTQDWAYPLFALLVYLLAADARRASLRVLWCLPLLVLWGNLHGSAVLGAVLAVLRGLTLAWERRRELSEARVIARVLALVVGAPACAALTPYGFAIVDYYRETLFNSGFSQFVTEWQPVTASPIVAGLFFLATGIAVWSFGRFPRQTTLWERLALLFVIGISIMGIRNVVWFGLAAIPIVSLSLADALNGERRPAVARPTLNLGLVAVASIALLIMVVASFAKPEATLAPSYPQRALALVAREARSQPGARIFVDERYADWLLWKVPFLRGRIAYDARFELLHARDLRRIIHFKTESGPYWRAAVAGYSLAVLDPQLTPDPVRALKREPSTRVLLAQRRLVVLQLGR